MAQFGLKVDIDARRIEQFMRSGHPRTVGIVLGLKPNRDALFAGVTISRFTVDGKSLEQASGPAGAAGEQRICFLTMLLPSVRTSDSLDTTSGSRA